MKTITGKIFTAKVTVERVQENSLAKKIKEEYAVKAVNFTDCEAKLTNEIAIYENVREGFDVLSEAVSPFEGVYIFDDGETYYKVKTEESYLDDFGNDKKKAHYYLLNATSFEQARKNIINALGNSLVDYTIAAVIKQNIIGVIE